MYKYKNKILRKVFNRNPGFQLSPTPLHSSFVYLHSLPNIQARLYNKMRVFCEERLPGVGEEGAGNQIDYSALEGMQVKDKAHEFAGAENVLTADDVNAAQQIFDNLFNTVQSSDYTKNLQNAVRQEINIFREEIGEASIHNMISTGLLRIITYKLREIRDAETRGLIRRQGAPEILEITDRMITRESPKIINALRNVLGSSANIDFSIISQPKNEVYYLFIQSIRQAKAANTSTEISHYETIFREANFMNSLVQAIDNHSPAPAQGEINRLNNFFTQFGTQLNGLWKSPLTAQQQTQFKTIIASRFTVLGGENNQPIRLQLNNTNVSANAIQDTLIREFAAMGIDLRSPGTWNQRVTQMQYLNGSFKRDINQYQKRKRVQARREAEEIPETTETSNRARDREAVFDAMRTVIGMRQEMDLTVFTENLPENQRNTVHTLIDGLITNAARNNRVTRSEENGPLNPAQLVAYVREGLDRPGVDSLLTMLETLNTEIQLTQRMLKNTPNFRALFAGALEHVNAADLGNVSKEHLAVFLALNYEITETNNRFSIGAPGSDAVTIPRQGGNATAFNRIIQSVSEVNSAADGAALVQMISRCQQQNVNLNRLRTSLDAYKDRAPGASNRFSLGTILRIIIAFITKKTDTIGAIIRNKTPQQERNERTRYLEREIRKGFTDTTNTGMIGIYNDPASIARRITALSYPPPTPGRTGAGDQTQRTDQRATLQNAFQNVLASLGGSSSLVKNGNIVMPGQREGQRISAVNYIKNMAVTRIAENLVDPEQNHLNSPRSLFQEFKKGHEPMRLAMNKPNVKTALATKLNIPNISITIGEVTYNQTARKIVIPIAQNRILELSENHVDIIRIAGAASTHAARVRGIQANWENVKTSLSSRNLERQTYNVVQEFLTGNENISFQDLTALVRSTPPADIQQGMLDAVNGLPGNVVSFDYGNPRSGATTTPNTLANRNTLKSNAAKMFQLIRAICATTQGNLYRLPENVQTVWNNKFACFSFANAVFMTEGNNNNLYCARINSDVSGNQKAKVGNLNNVHVLRVSAQATTYLGAVALRGTNQPKRFQTHVVSSVLQNRIAAALRSPTTT